MAAVIIIFIFLIYTWFGGTLGELHTLSGKIFVAFVTTDITASFETTYSADMTIIIFIGIAMVLWVYVPLAMYSIFNNNMIIIKEWQDHTKELIASQAQMVRTKQGMEDENHFADLIKNFESEKAASVSILKLYSMSREAKRTSRVFRVGVESFWRAIRKMVEEINFSMTPAATVYQDRNMYLKMTSEHGNDFKMAHSHNFVTNMHQGCDFVDVPKSNHGLEDLLEHYNHGQENKFIPPVNPEFDYQNYGGAYQFFDRDGTDCNLRKRANATENASYVNIPENPL